MKRTLASRRAVVRSLTAIAIPGVLAACSGDHGNEVHSAAVERAVKNIDTVVVIYAENRSFDNLYSDFPGQSDPLASARVAPQLDRDGKTVLKSLPPVWGGLTQARAQFANKVPVVPRAMTEGMPNAPFSINETYPGVDLDAVNADMWHNFYQNQMQINGGRNDMFAAWADNGGGLVMGLFTGNADKLPLWKVAEKYTMADHFFMGAFGGSFLNHQYLIAAAAPVVPVNDGNRSKVAKLSDGDQGWRLAVNPEAPGADSALSGPATAIFISNGATLTPDGYAVNTMQPAYQPSANKPAPNADGRTAGLLADPANPTTVPPQVHATIGDLLTQKHVGWAWYAGGWGFQTARSTNPEAWAGSDYASVGVGNGGEPFVNFQFHHQPFNYFKRFDPTTAQGRAERAEHLRDAGIHGEKFIQDIRAGALPPVAFYKPVGNLNEHSGYADVLRGDRHIAEVIAELEKSPQWPHMLVVVTYDENGGIWDHVAPPKGDRFGPGSRIPTILAGPTVRRHYVDHAVLDTTSILRFITRRWDLPELPGLAARRTALRKNAGVEQGDLSEALDVSSAS
ncbi:acid phosphatase [Bordetella genomosp. 9]|uniref:Acid phosphatase n=1 Tax=Bordetella genomosp. 9 TaxID=1416803 RepID=A0A1W6Z5B9_9BORD|nr:acid phosphatase [Bordetella genomosp. 9]ARP88538.1 hypothetical protein CAL13_04810 [Bordetella genomosp. 9]